MRLGTWRRAVALLITGAAALVATAAGSNAVPAAPAGGDAAGQPAGAGAVTGVGSAKAERQPELLRVTFQIEGEGKDVKEALARLREREKATRDKLAKLGAAAKAVALEEPRLAVSMANQQAQLNRLIQMRAAGRGAAAPATGPAQQPVKVSASARAEWPLAAKTTEEFLILAQDLETKVKAAELVPKDDKSNLTPEQVEELEEQAMMGEAAGQMQQQGPVFQYVSKVSPEDRAKLTAEAFAKAREDAKRLAKAAGADLGPIRQLTSTAASEDPGQPAYGGFDPYAYAQAMYGGVRPTPPTDADASEATATQPGKVTYRVTVSASFGIK